jgi:hypothetical protein
MVPEMTVVMTIDGHPLNSRRDLKRLEGKGLRVKVLGHNN